MTHKFDWKSAVSNFTLDQGRELASERGLSPLTFERLRDRGLIGSIYIEKFKARCVAFPVCDKNGKPYRAHARSPQRNGDGKWDWIYEPIKDPLGRPIPALLIGNAATATRVFLFESQWDGVGLIDRLDLFDQIDLGEVVIVATRGAQGAAMLKSIAWAAGASFYALPQNDFPGRDWLTKIVAITSGCYVVEPPKPHKDLGDWVKDPAFDVSALEWAIDHAPLEKPKAEAKDQQEEAAFQELLLKFRQALCTSEELETKQIKPRIKILGEWMREGDVGFVYGERGCGKTWFVVGIAASVSTGKDFQDWPVPNAIETLYVDGEMAGDATRDRFMGLAKGNKKLHILHHEILFDSASLTMNLADPRTQRVITTLSVELSIKLLILDNLSCLFSGVKENDADAWELINNWLLDFRRRRIAVMLVHHAGRSGFMRGTTKREDPLDWIIKVTRNAQDMQSDKLEARFSTDFEKQRSGPSEWSRKWVFKTEHNGEVSVAYEGLSPEGKVLQLIEYGVTSATDIANELKVAKSTVCKIAKRLESKKLIEIRNHRYYAKSFPGGNSQKT